jgi:hypothetical protein
MKHCQTLFWKKNSHKKENNEQLKKKPMSNQKTTFKNANTLMGPIMKSYAKLLYGGKQTTSHLSHEVYFLKNGWDVTPSIKKAFLTTIFLPQDESHLSFLQNHWHLLPINWM